VDIRFNNIIIIFQQLVEQIYRLSGSENTLSMSIITSAHLHRWYVGRKILFLCVISKIIMKVKLNKILFLNLCFGCVYFMRSLVCKARHRWHSNQAQCTKKITRSMWWYLHKLSSASSTYGMLRPILVFPKKFIRKAAIRP
jgi:hypothetical protein